MENLQATLSECLKMVNITGEVKATDKEFHYIMDGMVVRDKHVIRHMSKDIIAKPVFQLLHDWLICDKIDYTMNRQHILTIATGYIRRYKDIYAVDLFPLPAKKVKVEEPVLRKEKKNGRKKCHGKIVSQLQPRVSTRRSKQGK